MARPFSKSNPGDILGSLIKEKMRRNRLDAADLARALFVSRSTLYNRLDRTADFTYLELHLLFRALQFTPQEIVMVMSPIKLSKKGQVNHGQKA